MSVAVPRGDVEAIRVLIAKRLQGVRGLRNQESFAARLDTPQQTLSQYESGKIPHNWMFLVRLHDDEGIDLNALLTARDNGR